jgi:3-hydroxyacyl-CoA dehydrogenase
MKPDGILLSPGPGDPELLDYVGLDTTLSVMSVLQERLETNIAPAHFSPSMWKPAIWE